MYSLGYSTAAAAAAPAHLLHDPLLGRSAGAIAVLAVIGVSSVGIVIGTFYPVLHVLLLALTVVLLFLSTRPLILAMLFVAPFVLLLLGLLQNVAWALFLLTVLVFALYALAQRGIIASRFADAVWGGLPFLPTPSLLGVLLFAGLVRIMPEMWQDVLTQDTLLHVLPTSWPPIAAAGLTVLAGGLLASAVGVFNLPKSRGKNNRLHRAVAGLWLYGRILHFIPTTFLELFLRASHVRGPLSICALRLGAHDEQAVQQFLAHASREVGLFHERIETVWNGEDMQAFFFRPSAENLEWVEILSIKWGAKAASDVLVISGSRSLVNRMRTYLNEQGKLFFRSCFSPVGLRLQAQTFHAYQRIQSPQSGIDLDKTRRTIESIRKQLSLVEEAEASTIRDGLLALENEMRVVENQSRNASVWNEYETTYALCRSRVHLEIGGRPENDPSRLHRRVIGDAIAALSRLRGHILTAGKEDVDDLIGRIRQVRNSVINLPIVELGFVTFTRTTEGYGALRRIAGI